MRGFFGLVWVVLVLCCLSTTASPTSWIYTAPRAIFGLAGSASASASSASPKSVIADLRRKDAKAAELQEFNGEGAAANNEDTDKGEEEEEENNEATPNLFQKKINKILAKLRLIAQIKHAYHYKPETNDNPTTQEPPVKTNSTVTIQKYRQEPILDPRTAPSRSQNIQQIPPMANHQLELQESVENDAPLKVDLDNVEVVVTPQTPLVRSDKLRSEPNRLGALGVFFAELVGSIVGLTYGAVAQITSGGQSPVTLSTSEGL